MHGVPWEKQWRDSRYLTRLTSHWGASDSSHCWCVQFPGVSTFYWQGHAYTGAAPTAWGACGSPHPVAICATQCAGVRSQWGTPAHGVTSHWWGHIWGWLFILLSSHFPSPHCPSLGALSIAQPAGKFYLCSASGSSAQAGDHPRHLMQKVLYVVGKWLFWTILYIVLISTRASPSTFQLAPQDHRSSVSARAPHVGMCPALETVVTAGTERTMHQAGIPSHWKWRVPSRGKGCLKPVSVWGDIGVFFFCSNFSSFVFLLVVIERQGLGSSVCMYWFWLTSAENKVICRKDEKSDLEASQPGAIPPNSITELVPERVTSGSVGSTAPDPETYSSLNHCCVAITGTRASLTGSPWSSPHGAFAGPGDCTCLRDIAHPIIECHSKKNKIRHQPGQQSQGDPFGTFKDTIWCHCMVSNAVWWDSGCHSPSFNQNFHSQLFYTLGFL